MLDLKTLVDIRRVLTDYLTAWHTDGGFEELLELTKKVNSAIIEARLEEKEDNRPKKTTTKEDFKAAIALAKKSKEEFSENYNLFAMYEDCEGMICMCRADNLNGILFFL